MSVFKTTQQVGFLKVIGPLLRTYDKDPAALVGFAV